MFRDAERSMSCVAFPINPWCRARYSEGGVRVIAGGVAIGRPRISEIALGGTAFEGGCLYPQNVKYKPFNEAKKSCDW